MQDRVQRGADHCHQRHQLRQPVEGMAPGPLDQQQQGRDKGARVADPQPPDVIEDAKSPMHRLIIAPHAHAIAQQHSDRAQVHQQQHQADTEHPAPGNAPGELLQWPEHLPRHLLVAQILWQEMPGGVQQRLSLHRRRPPPQCAPGNWCAAGCRGLPASGNGGDRGARG